KCPPDSVKVGNVCIDTYEASVWQIPPSNTALVRLVQAGKATLANLTAGGGAQPAPARVRHLHPPRGHRANIPNHGDPDARPGTEPAVARGLRRVHRRGPAERVHQLVPGE